MYKTKLPIDEHSRFRYNTVSKSDSHPKKTHKQVKQMYVNRADWGKPHEDILDLSRPLLITAVGHYRFQTVPRLRTSRPDGRDDYQLIYVVGGIVHFVFDGEDRALPRGTAVLFRPGEAQDYYATSEEKAEYYWCHFTGADVEAVLADCGIPTDESVFTAGGSSDYQWLFLQMIRELQMKQRSHEDILLMNLRHILLLIGRNRQEERTVGDKILGEIESAIRCFNMYYYLDIDISEYAQNHLMSPYWFSQNFKKITKTSPKQYLISLRMANAMNLLDNTDDTVVQIAAAVGYDNAQYFHRLFLKHTGMTPTAYRKRKK